MGNRCNIFNNFALITCFKYATAKSKTINHLGRKNYLLWTYCFFEITKHWAEWVSSWNNKRCVAVEKRFLGRTGLPFYFRPVFLTRKRKSLNCGLFTLLLVIKRHLPNGTPWKYRLVQSIKIRIIFFRFSGLTNVKLTYWKIHDLLHPLLISVLSDYK